MAILRIPVETFFIDRSSTRPLQVQIRETVVSAILMGQVLPGGAMPSTRSLAEHLGIARMTVTLAFQELVAQGYLEPQARSGYVVSEVGTVYAPTESTPLSDQYEAAQPVWGRFLDSALSNRRRVSKAFDWRTMRYPFVYGQMDPALFRYSAWRDCVRQATGRRDFDDMAGDLAAADDPILVNYIRTRSLPRRAISATSDQILVTVGAQNAIWLAIELLTRRPLHAVCENPGYPDTLQALRWCGAAVTTVDVDENGLPPGKIPDGIQAVFVTPGHHAPTGVTMPLERRKQLLRDAENHDFVIIEDDYDFEMSFLEAPGPALKSLDRSDRVLYVGSFSKAIFPGLRLGYLVGSAPVIAEARELRSMMLRNPPGHHQRTAAYFLAQGHYDLLIRDMRKQFSHRREVMQAALENSGLEIAGNAQFGGSSLWIKGPEGLDSTQLAIDLLEDEVVIEPGAPFFDDGSAQSRFFRLGYSSIPADRIDAGIRHIVKRC